MVFIKSARPSPAEAQLLLSRAAMKTAQAEIGTSEATGAAEEFIT